MSDLYLTHLWLLVLWLAHIHLALPPSRVWLDIDARYRERRIPLSTAHVGCFPTRISALACALTSFDLNNLQSVDGYQISRSDSNMLPCTLSVL